MERLMSRKQARTMRQLWASLEHERQIPLLGSWLVLTVNPWWWTLTLAGRGLVGKARGTRSLRQGWFAGRLRPEERP